MRKWGLEEEVEWLSGWRCSRRVTSIVEVEVLKEVLVGMKGRQ